MKNIILSSIVCFAFSLYGQGSITVNANRDTILLGNTVKISFEIENLDGDFEAPTFDRLPIVSGPNTSMSMSIINGTTSKTSTYSYIILPEETGTIFIEPGYVNTGDTIYETPVLALEVVENPEGITQKDESSDFGFHHFFNRKIPQQTTPKDSQRSKKKRKIKRI